MEWAGEVGTVYIRSYSSNMIFTERKILEKLPEKLDCRIKIYEVYRHGVRLQESNPESGLGIEITAHI